MTCMSEGILIFKLMANVSKMSKRSSTDFPGLSTLACDGFLVVQLTALFCRWDVQLGDGEHKACGKLQQTIRVHIRNFAGHCLFSVNRDWLRSLNKKDIANLPTK